MEEKGKEGCGYHKGSVIKLTAALGDYWLGSALGDRIG